MLLSIYCNYTYLILQGCLTGEDMLLLVGSICSKPALPTSDTWLKGCGHKLWLKKSNLRTGLPACHLLKRLLYLHILFISFLSLVWLQHKIICHIICGCSKKAIWYRIEWLPLFFVINAFHHDRWADEMWNDNSMMSESRSITYDTRKWTREEENKGKKEITNPRLVESGKFVIIVELDVLCFMSLSSYYKINNIYFFLSKWCVWFCNIYYNS